MGFYWRCSRIVITWKQDLVLSCGEKERDRQRVRFALMVIQGIKLDVGINDTVDVRKVE